MEIFLFQKVVFFEQKVLTFGKDLVRLIFKERGESPQEKGQRPGEEEMSYECCNCGALSGTSYDSLEEAQNAMREWGYIPADEDSCDGSSEYWVDPNDLPGDATSLDDLEDSAAWLDRYLGDGAYAPQIVRREE